MYQGSLEMISAEEARTISKQAQENVDKIDKIKPYIEEIDTKIKNAAKEGKNRIINPFSNLKGIGISFENIRLLEYHYKKLGFSYGHSPATDPGDPRGDGSFDYLSW